MANNIVVKFERGLICSDTGSLCLGDVWVQEGKLIDPLKLFYVDKKSPDVVVDCRGLIIAPGFIDIQINGELTWFLLSDCTISPVLPRYI